MSFPTRATAYAPGSIGNLGPGLDVLGCAVEGAGDTVSAEFTDARGVTVVDSGHPSLSTDPTMHASAIAAMAVVRRATHLGATTALFSETQVAGRHLDNIAPSYMGGIVLIRSLDPIDVMAVPVPAALHVVLASPEQSLRTAEARAVLPVEVSLHVALHQAAQVAGIVAALHTGDLSFLGRCIDDRIAEPVRSHLLPGFARAKQAAMAAGALGVSISGAGPTAFALCDGEAAGDRIATAMCDAYRSAGIGCSVRVTRPDLNGTRVEIVMSE